MTYNSKYVGLGNHLDGKHYFNINPRESIIYYLADTELSSNRKACLTKEREIRVCG